MVIADDSKRVAQLGAFPLPVEIVRFGWPADRGARSASSSPTWTSTAARSSVRMGTDGPLVTDEGQHILDLHLGADRRSAGAGRGARTRCPAWSSTGSSSTWRDRVVIGRADGTTEVLLPARRASAGRHRSS